jgi:hypothetical protein
MMRLKASWWLPPKLLLVQELAFNDKSTGRTAMAFRFVLRDKGSRQKTIVGAQRKGKDGLRFLKFGEVEGLLPQPLS